MSRPGRGFWILLAAAAAALAIAFDVAVIDPRVAVRWTADVDPQRRVALEARYGLLNGRQDGGPEWRYELGDLSRENIRALVRDPAVADTQDIDRSNFAADRRRLRITMRSLLFPLGSPPGPTENAPLFRLQTLCLLLAGGALLLASRTADDRLRGRTAAITLLAVAGAMYGLPLQQSFLRMGDAGTYTASRQAFESYAGVTAVRFEAHLSQALLGRIYEFLGRSPDAHHEALTLLMRGGTAWFILCAFGIGYVERWSPLVVRYLALSLLAPSALLYFGYRELGYHSLNVAAFPLLARGLHAGSARLEAGSTLAGLGAALHAFGLLSLAGAWLAAMAGPGRLLARTSRTLRSLAWGTAAYLGWIAVYVIVLKLPVIPGHAQSIPLRPWLADEFVAGDDRVNVAILSLAGARDLFFTGWVIGAPLLAVAGSLWRRHRDELRMAVWYTIPAALFVVALWPVQGLGPDVDLLFAAFPAFYALAWVCAHDSRRTTWAAALLVSAHVAFWRIVLDGTFVN